jgi:hypothetical protein
MLREPAKGDAENYSAGTVIFDPELNIHASEVNTPPETETTLSENAPNAWDVTVLDGGGAFTGSDDPSLKTLPSDIDSFGSVPGIPSDGSVTNVDTQTLIQLGSEANRPINIPLEDEKTQTVLGKTADQLGVPVTSEEEQKDPATPKTQDNSATPAATSTADTSQTAAPDAAIETRTESTLETEKTPLLTSESSSTPAGATKTSNAASDSQNPAAFALSIFHSDNLEVAQKKLEEIKGKNIGSGTLYIQSFRGMDQKFSYRIYLGFFQTYNSAQAAIAPLANEKIASPDSYVVTIFADEFNMHGGIFVKLKAPANGDAENYSAGTGIFDPELKNMEASVVNTPPETGTTLPENAPNAGDVTVLDGGGAFTGSDDPSLKTQPSYLDSFGSVPGIPSDSSVTNVDTQTLIQPGSEANRPINVPLEGENTQTALEKTADQLGVPVTSEEEQKAPATPKTQDNSATPVATSTADTSQKTAPDAAIETRAESTLETAVTPLLTSESSSTPSGATTTVNAASNSQKPAAFALSIFHSDNLEVAQNKLEELKGKNIGSATLYIQNFRGKDLKLVYRIYLGFFPTYDSAKAAIAPLADKKMASPNSFVVNISQTDFNRNPGPFVKLIAPAN